MNGVEIKGMVPYCIERLNGTCPLGWGPWLLCGNVTVITSHTHWWIELKHQGMVPTFPLPPSSLWVVPLWLYPLAIFLPAAGDIIVETQVTALATQTAQALNQTCTTLSLLADEVDQIRKVLQNEMPLDILTAAQGGACAIFHTQFVYASQTIRKTSPKP